MLRRLGFLNDISGIMSAMKALALMEMRMLEEFLAAQHRMVASIEASAARFIVWHPKLARIFHRRGRRNSRKARYYWCSRQF